MQRTVYFGPEEQLVGTMCVPDSYARRQRPLVAILSNSGVIGRAGPNRLNVVLARRLAAIGVASFRFDMSGLGDSGNSSSTASAAERWVSDTRAGMDFVVSHLGQCDFVMVGLCSGADIAYLTALEDSRLVAAVFWDLYCYPTRRSAMNAFGYRFARSGFAGLWRAMRRLRVPAASSPPSIVHPEVVPWAGNGFYGRVDVPTRMEFSANMNRLVARRFRPYFMYSGSARDEFNYAGQFRDMFGEFEFFQRSDYAFLAENDHLFSQPHMRERFCQKLERWIADLLSSQ